jgi:CHU_C Type IX secretion signal domain
MKNLLAFLLMAVIVCCVACSKTEYYATSISYSHCKNLANDTLYSIDSAYFAIPNAFSPNRDTINEKFEIKYGGLLSMTTTIYDSLNAIVYKSDSIGNFWSPWMGTLGYKEYFYRVEALAKNGKRVGVCGSVFPLYCVPLGTPKEKYSFISQYDSASNSFNKNKWSDIKCP